jgi:tetratricopeptide (TPR) repeat protein/transcriptional regulator with XRE-family HTH domain
LAEQSISFANLLKQLRTAAGLTQEELAEAAGLSPRSISDLERGINLTARRDTARLLADALSLQGPDRVTFEATARGHRRAAIHHAPGELGRLPETAGVAVATRALPRDTATFAGREHELAQLVQAIRNTAIGATRVVAIHAIDGMAGIGKTTFAVHAAHHLASRFPDGQIFLRLHGHTPGQRPAEPADALATLLLMLGVPARQIPPDIEARAGLWRDQMSGKRALLVLDDATGSDQVRPLLPGTAGTLVLVTSRRRLAALPEALPLTLDLLRPSQAGELFARLVDRSDVQASDSRVADLARLCGYLPLAISLMAGQLKHHRTWSLTDLTTKLASTHDRLAAIRAEDYSVAAALDLSYTDLDAHQQQFFRRLGLQSGADIDDYAAAALAGTELTAAEKLLEDLYTHHLIDEPSRGRYRFHDLIREHARTLALADEPVERGSAISRLLGYYTHTARAADHHLARRTPIALPITTDNQPVQIPLLATRGQSVVWMETERLNLHAAVNQAANDNLVKYAIALPVAMHGFLRINGHWGQALTLHNIALAVARQEGDTLGEAAAHANIGDVKYLIGDYPAAIAKLTTAMELFRSLGNKLGEANCLSTLGIVRRLTGDPMSAIANLTSSLEFYRVLGDQLGEAIALSELGNAQYVVGNHIEATASLHAALVLLKDLNDQNGQAATLIYLGVVQRANGDYSSATESLTRALALYRETGTPWGEANVYLALGDMQRVTGDLISAATSLTRTLRLYRDLGHRSGEAEALNSMGELSLLSSLNDEARARFTLALTIARDITAPLEEARALEGIGRCEIGDGRVREGTAALQQALAIYRNISSLHSERIVAMLREQA